MIQGVGIRTADGKLWALPQPHRHADVTAEILRAKADPRGSTAGFTACSFCQPGDRCMEEPHGFFVTRPAAEVIARAAGQIKGNLIGPWLTSDDLW